MDWHKLKKEIYYSDGSWRDIYILDTTLSDWEKWVTYVNQNYEVEFYNGQKKQTKIRIDYNLIVDFWEHKTGFLNSSIINIDNIKVNCHFFHENEIVNDIDPNCIETINDHDKMIKYMMDLSKLLDKKVIMTAERMRDIIYISVDKDIVEIHKPKVETTVIKQCRTVRNENGVLSFLAFLFCLPMAIYSIDDSVFLAIFMGIFGCICLFQFIRNICIYEIPAEIIVSDVDVFFKSVGTFKWDEINAFEISHIDTRNEDGIGTSTYLDIFLQNGKLYHFCIDLLDQNAAEIIALFKKFTSRIPD